MSHVAFLGTEAGLFTVRLVNIALVVVLAALILLLARAYSNLARGVLISIVITWIPLGLFLVPSPNGSSWTITGVTFFWAFLWVGIRDTHISTSIAAWGGALLSGIMAIGSRFDGAVYVALSAAVVVFISWNERGGRLQSGLAVGLCVIATSATLFVYRMTGQGGVVSRGLMATENFQAASLQVFWSNLLRLPGLFLGVFGIDGFGSGLGWLDTPMPPITWTFMLVCASVTITKISTGLSVRQALGTIAILVALISIPLYVLQVDRAVVGQNVQSRYMLPLLTVLVGIALVSDRADDRQIVELSRRFRWSISIGVTIAHGAALHTNMRRYISGLDVVSPNLNEGRDWWPSWAPDPNLCWLAATAVTFVVVFEILRIGAKPTRDIPIHDGRALSTDT